MPRPLALAPSAPPALVGRTHEQRTLVALVTDLRRGTGGVATIAGEPGIGKSALLGWTAVLAEQHGVAVRAGAARRWTPTPFDLVVQPLVGLPDAAALTATQLRGPGTAHLDLVDHGTEGLQRDADAVIDCYESLAARRPLLVVLDDVDAADPASLFATVVLARRARVAGYGVVVAYADPVRAPDARRAITMLEGAATHQLVLDPLTPEQSTTVARTVAGATPTGALLDRVSASAGNPRLIRELCAGAEPGPALAASVLARFGPGDAEAVELLRLAAVLGTDFDVTDLATVARRPPASLVAALERARQARVLDGSDEARLAFTSSLIRDALYDELPAPIRRALHLDVARSLMTAGASPSVTAPHLAAGALEGDTAAVEEVARAGDLAMPVAPAAAAVLFQRAAALAPPGPRRDQLLSRLAQAWCWAGRHDDAHHVATAVLARPHDIALDADLAFVALRARCVAGRLDEALALAARPGLLDGQPLLRAQLAKVRAYAGDLAGASDEALRARREAGPAPDDATVLSSALLALIRSREGHVDEALRLADQAVSAADEGPPDLHRHHPHVFRAAVLDRAGQASAALQALATAEEVAGRLGMMAPTTAVLRATTLWRLGHWSDAIAEARAEVATAEESGTRFSIGWAFALQALIAVHQGDTARGLSLYARGDQAATDAATVLGREWLTLARAMVLSAGGDERGAATVLTTFCDAAAAAGGIDAVAALAPDLVRAQLAGGGDPARLGQLLGWVQEAATRSQRAVHRATAGWVEGLLAADGRQVLGAAEELASTEWRVARAQATHDAAALLAAHDPGVATELLQSAVSTYLDIGARWWVDRAAADAHRAGLRVRTRRKASAPTSGWGSLTATELIVTTGVEDGLTNGAIAQRMGISKRTVEAHLRSVFAKLQVASRLELALRAGAERGLHPRADDGPAAAVPAERL